MTFWRERGLDFLESKKPHQETTLKQFYLGQKVKHLEDEKHQYLIAFGLSVHGFQT